MGVLNLMKTVRAPFQSIAQRMTQQHTRVATALHPLLATSPNPIAAGASDLDDPNSLEDCISDTCSSYAGEIDTQQVSGGITAPLFQNPVPVALSAFMIARENSSRREIMLVNVGIVAIYIGYGFPPTSTNYSVALVACSSPNDGTGGIWINDSWKGPVFVLAGGASGGAVNFTEILNSEGGAQKR